MNNMLFRCVPIGLLAGIVVSATAQMPKAPTFNKPVPNAPKVRVDGRVRGTDDAVTTLTVLAPEEVGQTTKAQPSLFWYQSKPSRTRFELTITEGRNPKPLLELQLDRPPTEGIQRMRLAEHNVTLKAGVEYRWSVAVIVDEENRSKDIIASGVIKRVEAPATLAKRLASAPEAELPFIYADEGVWYDSLESLSDLIEKQPTKKDLHEIRAVYFMQVGLNEAARYDLVKAGKAATGLMK